MLILGIDQKARQLTVSIRPAKILQFFDQLTQRCAEHNESFITFLEVCGFNNWLITLASVGKLSIYQIDVLTLLPLQISENL